MACVALLLTGTYSVCAALGSASGGRTNAAVHEQVSADTRSKIQASYDAARAEIAALRPSRPVGELEALLAASHHLRGKGCAVENGTGRLLCPKYAALLAELA